MAGTVTMPTNIGTAAVKTPAPANSTFVEPFDFRTMGLFMISSIRSYASDGGLPVF
jgi:hypothetical protein